MLWGDSGSHLLAPKFVRTQVARKPCIAKKSTSWVCPVRVKRCV